MELIIELVACNDPLLYSTITIVLSAKIVNMLIHTKNVSNLQSRAFLKMYRPM